MQVLWFKRDLRLSDHLPLFEAMRNAKHHGLVLPLYIHEPSQIADAHTARQHQLFVHECLDDLKQQLVDVAVTCTRNWARPSMCWPVCTRNSNSPTCGLIRKPHNLHNTNATKLWRPGAKAWALCSQSCLKTMYSAQAERN
jgi:hypothetical protein